jgi:antitoxin component YwqK of YwqJK toxin-antitoxin module
LNGVNYLVNNELNGKQTSFYKTGVIQSIEYFTDGSLNDSAFYYHDNATIYRKGKYVNDFYEGEWRSYYENGVLKQIGSYIAGNPHGVWFFYTDCAKLETQIEYLDGKKHGQYLMYHPKTQKVIERRKYENDIEIGVRTYYKKNGKQIRP